MSDEKTANRLYLLPASDNTLAVDLNRLRASLVQIDTDVAANLVADAARSILIGNNALAASANSAEITALKEDPIFSGNGSVPNQAVSINSSSIANTKFVQDVVAARLFLQGFINGLITARNVTTPNTHIDIGVGAAWTGDRIIQNVATFTKRLDAIWLAGTGNGGLFSGVRAANTWYHLFVLRNDTTGAIDFGFDTSVSGANRPTGWDARLIWSVRTDASSNIIPYSQTGDVCTWVTPPIDLNSVGSISSANGTLYTISTPLGLSCLVQIYVGANGPVGQIHYVSSPDTEDLAVSNFAIGGRYTTFSFNTASVFEGTLASTLSLFTNTASQIRVRAFNSTVSADVISIVTNFFTHPRGRLV